MASSERRYTDIRRAEPLADVIETVANRVYANSKLGIVDGGSPTLVADTVSAETPAGIDSVDIFGSE